MLCEFLIVIAAVAKVSRKHGLWLVAHVNKNAGNKDTMCFISCIFFVYRCVFKSVQLSECLYCRCFRLLHLR